MSYRLQLEGMRAEKQARLKELILRADAVVVELHMHANPHLPVDQLPVEKLRFWAEDLKRYVREIQALRDEIRTIERELGVADGD